MTKILITEKQLEILSKQVLNEQITPARDKKLNLFCKSNKTNSSFREYNLYFNQEQDLPNGVKKLILDRKTFVPDNVFGANDQSFILNVTPVNLAGDNFSDELGIDSPNENIVLISYKSGVPHYCQIDSDTDQDWPKYFNTF